MEKDTQSRAEANELRAKWLVDRAAARKQILEAFRQAGGNAVQTATLLGIGHRTLLRYMDDPAISKELESIRTRTAKSRAAERESKPKVSAKRKGKGKSQAVAQ